MTRLRYIAEIDGLRAIAVIPVLLYHLGFSWMPGGFFGVDVFFVISGYLITSILVAESEAPRRRYFVDFYVRRLRRIFPAFFVVVLVTVVTGFWLLLPEPYLDLGWSAVAAIAFASNFYFYLNTGYFDAPAESMPLLHTWSLAVEEQFYLVWPLVVLFFVRVGPRMRGALFVILFIASLVASLTITYRDPALAFYHFPFRAYQLMAGAAVAFWSQPRVSRPMMTLLMSSALQAVGLALILYAYLFFSARDLLPGWQATVPTVGAALVMFAVTAGPRLASNPLAHVVVTSIGKVSYSLYLWHWPLIVYFSIYVGGHAPSTSEKWCLAAGALALATCSYHCIEKPLRRPERLREAFRVTLAGFTTVCALWLGITATDGFTNRVPDPGQFASLKATWDWHCPHRVALTTNRELCNFGLPWHAAEHRILLWGDSHAEHLTPLLEAIATEHGLSFVLFPSCRPLTDGREVLVRHPNPERATAGCLHATNTAIDFLRRETPDLVILAGVWAASPPQLYTSVEPQPDRDTQLALFRRGLELTTSRILEYVPTMLLLGDTPWAGPIRQECAAYHSLPRRNTPDCSPIALAEVDARHGATEGILEAIGNRTGGVIFHSLIRHHCSSGACPIVVNGEYVYRDASHLRRNISPDVLAQLVRSFGLDRAVDWSAYAN